MRERERERETEGVVPGRGRVGSGRGWEREKVARAVRREAGGAAAAKESREGEGGAGGEERGGWGSGGEGEQGGRRWRRGGGELGERGRWGSGLRLGFGVGGRGGGGYWVGVWVVGGPIRDLANVGGLFRKTTAVTSTASTRGLPARHVSPGVRRGKERGAGFNISDSIASVRERLQRNGQTAIWLAISVLAILFEI
jgi:hypothetical protein